MRWPWRHIVVLGLSVLAAAWLALAANPAAAEGVATGGGSSLPLATPGVDPSGGAGGGSGPSGGDSPGGGSSVPIPPPPPPGSYEAMQGDGGGGGGNYGNPGSAGGPNIEIPGLLPDQPQGPSVSPDEIIVVFPGNLNRSVGSAFAADHNSTIVDYFRLPGLNAHVFLMSLRDAAQFGQRFNKMAQDPRPLWVQPNPAFATTPSRKLKSLAPQMGWQVVDWRARRGR